MVEVISRVINLRWNQKWKYLFNTISFSFNSPYDIDTCDPVKPRLLELKAEVEDPTNKKGQFSRHPKAYHSDNPVFTTS